MNTVFIETKCSKTKKNYWMRYDYSADDLWIWTYCYTTLPANEANRGSENINFPVSNNGLGFFSGPQNHGCPWCGDKGWVHCGKCGRYYCKGHSKEWECPWCGKVTDSSKLTTAKSGTGSNGGQ